MFLQVLSLNAYILHGAHQNCFSIYNIFSLFLDSTESVEIKHHHFCKQIISESY